MNLQSRPDFDKVLARFEAWWQCQIIDRPPVSINVHGKGSPRYPVKSHATTRDRWMDIEHALDCFEAGLDKAVFAGDGYPMFMPNIGPEVVATCFGCELEFADHTSYSKPSAAGIRQILDFKPNLDNPYWNAIRRGTDLSLERGKGRWITGVTDLHTNGDLLASLRDPQNLCMDLADDPEGVRLACEHVTNFFTMLYDDLYSRIAAAGQPSTTWLNSLHMGRSYASSCDFICMISPAMFQETILPSITRENSYLSRSIFHLDGPGALKHLDALLEGGNITGLQWVYGAGNGPASKWIDVYQKAQAAGKCLQLLCESMEDAKTLAEHLRPEGTWFCVGGAYTTEEASAFIDWLTKWAAGHAGR